MAFPDYRPMTKTVIRRPSILQWIMGARAYTEEVKTKNLEPRGWEDRGEVGETKSNKNIVHARCGTIVHIGREKNENTGGISIFKFCPKCLDSKIGEEIKYF